MVRQRGRYKGTQMHTCRETIRKAQRCIHAEKLIERGLRNVLGGRSAAAARLDK